MPIIETLGKKNVVAEGDGEPSQVFAVKTVDAYEISISDHVAGFKTIVLAFMLADGSVESYAFPPLYAHALSDELLTASARAAKK